MGIPAICTDRLGRGFVRPQADVESILQRLELKAGVQAALLRVRDRLHLTLLSFL